MADALKCSVPCGRAETKATTQSYPCLRVCVVNILRHIGRGRRSMWVTPALLLLASCAAPQQRPWSELSGLEPLTFPPGHRYSLDDMIDLAIRHNAQLDQARYEADAANALIDQVKSFWLPQLRYGAGIVVFDNDLSFQTRALRTVAVGVPITGSYNAFQALLGTQILATSGKRTSGLRQAKLFARIMKLETLRVRDALAYDVANFYLLVLLTSDIDIVLEDTLRRLRVFRQVVDGLNQRGSQRASKLDVLKADYFIAQIEQGLVQVRTGRYQAFQALRQSVGLSREEPMPLAASNMPPPIDPSEWLSAYGQIVKGFFQRPELRMVDYFAKIRERQVEFAKAGFGPNLIAIFGGIDSLGKSNNIIDQDFLAAGLILDLPIYTPGQKAALRKSLAERNATDAFQRRIEELIALEIEVSAIETQKTMANVLKASRARTAAVDHYEASRQAFTRQLINGEDLVTALGLDTQAKIQYIQTLFDYHVAKAKLKRVTAERENGYGF